MELIIKYSLEKDLWTYKWFLKGWGCLYGVDDKSEFKRLPNKVQELLHGKETDKIKFKKLAEYLKRDYENKKSDIEKNIMQLGKSWKEIGNENIANLENFYGKRCPFDKVSVFITTNIFCPYNYEERYLYIQTGSLVDQLDTIQHELNHFMFYYYYPKLERKLGKNKYELLKESLTFFTNPNQSGYPDEKRLRELYTTKKWGNIDEIIEVASKLLC